MPPRQKSKQLHIVETVLIFSLVVLAGHLFSNFWGRYKVQTELLKMKTSLNTLKDTVNQIGIAYNELHKELQGLAEITENGNLMDAILPDNYIIDNKKHQSKVLPKKHINDLQLHALVNNGIINEKPRRILDRYTQTILNETTSYNPAAYLEVAKKDEYVGDKGVHNKKIQYNTHLRKHKHTKSAAIVTKNSPRSTAANTETNEPKSTVDPINFKNNMHHNNIHRCHSNHKNDDCPNKDSNSFVYATF